MMQVAAVTLAMHLGFATPGPFVPDLTGNFPALLHAAAWHAVPGPSPAIPALRLADGEAIELAEARLLLGATATRGSLCLWLRPSFDPASLPSDTWHGYAVIAYIQKRSTNGLPDGYNEIGLALHGPHLLAKVAGSDSTARFADLPCPLRKGQWTHLALTWAPSRRRLYVDGKLAAHADGAYAAPVLDDFDGWVGCHPVTHKWYCPGDYADVRLYRTELSPEDVAALARR